MLSGHEAEDHVAIAAQALATSAPDAWDQLMKALGQRADLVVHHLISADPSSLPNLQGRAAEARDLYASLVGWRERIEQIRKRKSYADQQRRP